jgi:hypothetical protein
MHAARFSHSKRLQRVYACLHKHKRGLTTRQIVQRAEVCAVNSIISELRANGAKISCTLEGVAKDGTRTYRYALGDA